MEVKKNNVNCHESKSEFDEKAVEEEDAKLILSSMEKELEDVKDKLKNVCNKTRKSEAELKSVKLKLCELKTKMEETRTTEWVGIVEDGKDTGEKLGLNLQSLKVELKDARK